MSKLNYCVFVYLLLLGCDIGYAQKDKTMNDTTNALMCDTTTGICTIPQGVSQSVAESEENVNKPLKIIYYTDPICSTCWGIEPYLRKLKLEYAHVIEIEYRMGGLLPDWSYNSGGISKPSDVAHHWDEVSAHYHMPIDGDVWLQDPLHSSFPPSIAFKAAQMQDVDKAIVFLRRIREMVFLERKNITKWQYISDAAIYAKLNVALMEQHYKKMAESLFKADLSDAAKDGVRGFPTVFIEGGNTPKETIYGFRPYEAFVGAISSKVPGIKPKEYNKDWQSLFGHYPSMTVREYSVLTGTDDATAQMALKQLVSLGKLLEYKTKNGSLYRLVTDKV